MGTYNTLAGCLPQLLTAFDCLTTAAAGLGVTFEINDYGGLRTPAIEQRILTYRQTDYNNAVAAGRIPASESIEVFRPIADTTGFGNSFHDFGAAFDVSPVAWPAGWDYDAAVNALGQLAFYCGLRWPLPNSDPAHFELDISIDQARQLYEQFTGTTFAAGRPGGSGAWLALGTAVAIGAVVVWAVYTGAGQSGGGQRGAA